MFETLTIGLAVGFVAFIVVALFNSQYRNIMQGLLVIGSVGLVIAFLYSLVEFSDSKSSSSGQRGNLEQTLLNNPRCELINDGRIVIKVKVPNAGKYDSNAPLFGSDNHNVTIACDMTYGEQCRTYKGLKTALNMNDIDMQKYLPFLCK